MGAMDLTIRDWMVVVGVLLIVAVLLDAWRRIRRDRSAAVKMRVGRQRRAVGCARARFFNVRGVAKWWRQGGGQGRYPAGRGL